MARTADDRRRRLGVLISGRGSNLQSIVDAIAARRLDATHRRRHLEPRGRCRAGARARGGHRRRLAEPARLRRAATTTIARSPASLGARGVDLVCLAGFMRLVGPPLLDAFPNRVLNIHPSLLPSFPGLDAQRQALEHGVRVSGATVHLVTSELDAGPIVLQAAVPVARRRHRGDAGGADSRRRTPHLSRGDSPRARRRMDDRGPPVRPPAPRVPSPNPEPPHARPVE